MHIIKKCEQDSDYNYGNWLELTCNTGGKIIKEKYGERWLRKIAFRENRGGNDFSCPICKLKISKMYVFTRIELIGQKVLNFFASHLTFFKLSSAILGGTVVVLSGMAIANLVGLTGLVLYILAEVGAFYYGMCLGDEVAIATVGISETVSKEAVVILISQVVLATTQVAILSIFGGLLVNAFVSAK